MAKYIIIDHHMLEAGKVLTKDDIMVSDLTDEQLGWLMDAQKPGGQDVIIDMKGIKSKL